MPGRRVRLRSLARDLEPRLHAVRARRRRRPHAPAEAVDRHRRGPRAHGGGRAGQALELRHRHLPEHHQRHREARGQALRRDRGRRRRLDARHRRPRPGDHVPRRRRRPPVERGARLRAAPDHAPRDPAREAARARAALPGRRVRGGDGGDGRRVPGDPREPRVHHQGGGAGGGVLPPHARQGARDPRGRDAQAHRARDAPRQARDSAARAGAAGHRGQARVPALRHVRLPARSHPCHRGGARLRRGRAGLRSQHGRAARPLRVEGLRRAGRRRSPQADRGRARRDPLPRLRDAHRARRGEGAHRERRARREGAEGRPGRGRDRGDPVLRRVGRPGRRPRQPLRAGRADPRGGRAAAGARARHARGRRGGGRARGGRRRGARGGRPAPRPHPRQPLGDPPAPARAARDARAST